MKSNNNSETTKSESSLSFHHFHNIYSKISNHQASVALISPYYYKRLGINGHKIHSFRNSDLKTPELTDSSYELNKNYFKSLFSKNLNKFNHMVTNSTSAHLASKKANVFSIANENENEDATSRKFRLNQNESKDDIAVRIRPSSLTDLSDRLRKIYSDSLDGLLANKPSSASAITPQTKIIYNLSKIHMQNKLQNFNKIGSRNNSRLNEY